MINNRKKLRLLDIALKHSLPKLSIEHHINEDIPQNIQITFVDSNGNEKVNRKSLDNFKFNILKRFRNSRTERGGYAYGLVTVRI